MMSRYVGFRSWAMILMRYVFARAVDNRTPEQVLAAAEHRIKDLAEGSRRTVEATATLWQYAKELELA
ncbi:MAG: hypothetical protein NVSMB49_00870 [Ktedonobacteraceae bacterium]